MSYSVKNAKNKIALRLQTECFLSEQLCRANSQIIRLLSLTVSNELYYILINNSMIKRVIKNLLELLRVADSSFYFQNLYISKVV